MILRESEGTSGLKRFSPSVYMKIGLDELVTVSLYFLRQTSKAPTFENLVAKAFEFFPQRFAMVGHPSWPDSALVNKSWLRCRSDKKLIAGSVATGFELTPKGEMVARKILFKLGQTSDSSLEPSQPTPSKRGDRRTPAGRVVSRVEGSSAFKKFKLNGNLNDITEYELCDLLYSTLESSPETLSKNFDILLQNLQEYSRNDLIEFMNQLRNRFLKRFVISKRRGGMLPQKDRN